MLRLPLTSVDFGKLTSGFYFSYKLQSKSSAHKMHSRHSNKVSRLFFGSGWMELLLEHVKQCLMLNWTIGF